MPTCLLLSKAPHDYGITICALVTFCEEMIRLTQSWSPLLPSLDKLPLLPQPANQSQVELSTSISIIFLPPGLFYFPDFSFPLADLSSSLVAMDL